MSKQIYHYDPVTGDFTGAAMARESPLEPGVFFIPANATTEAPPACGDSQRPVYLNGGWIIEDIPQPEQEPAPTLDEIKSESWGKIKAERDRRTQTGGYKVGEKWFHSDTFSRGQQLGLVLLGTNIPAGLQWKTMDGSFVAMTQQLAGQVLAAAAASDQAIFAAAETHKAAMEASTDPADYNFSAGWPETFGG